MKYAKIYSTAITVLGLKSGLINRYVMMYRWEHTGAQVFREMKKFAD
jgi:hypothetical protein